MIDNSFHIITFGCQMNVHDSQWLARALEARGFCEAPLEEARVVVVNTCSVREKPEQKVISTLGRIRQVTGNSPRVLVAVTGCVAQQLGEKLFSRQVRLVAGSDGISGAPQAIERLLDEPALRLSLLDFTSHYVEREPGADTPSAPVGFVNIMQGCDNFCAYCIVPYTRGRQKSRLTPAILDECRHLLDRGAREITLLGQNVNSYGKDLGENVDFPTLLEMANAIPGDFLLRFMTSHPKDATERLFDVMARCEKVAPVIHLPFQSGNTRVLQAMNRRYTREQYLDKVRALRARIPDVVLTSDVIVGFPGETTEEFEDTLSLVEQVRFDALFTFIYSPRKGTPAAEMPDPISKEEKSASFNRLVEAQNRISLEKHQAYIGTVQRCLVDGEGEDPRHNLTARTPGGRLVHLDGDKGLIGQFVDVEITDCSTWALFGRKREG